MEVKSHKKPLAEVVILRKLRLAALEVLLIGVIVANLHFVWSSSTRLFMKNRFSQFSPIYELGKFQRQALNLAALRVGDAKERIYSGRSRRSTRGRSAWTWGGASHLWFILTTSRMAEMTLHRNGRRGSYSSWSCLVFAAMRVAATPRHRRGAKV
jgi:hypothetical protein